MSFANPIFFLLFIILIISIFLYLKQSKLNSIQISYSNPSNNFNNLLDKFLYHLPFILRILCISLIIICLARPQFGQSFSTNKNLGLDILLAVDTSQSMSALDLKLNNQNVDRLTVVKKF